MNYYQERIETDPVIPAKIYIGNEHGNAHYPLHWHEHLEFDLVLCGAIAGRVNGRAINVRAGEFLFVNSGDLHETNAEDMHQTRAVTLLLSSDLLKEYCPDADAYDFDFTDRPHAREAVRALILQCAKLYEKREAFYTLALSIALRQICYTLLRDCRRPKQVSPFHTNEQKRMLHIKKALAFMERHYTDTLTLSGVAAQIGMATTYFARFFRKTTDDTFYGYLTKIRLYHAHAELVNGDASVTEIALSNGFPNVKAFIEAFKKSYQSTPAKYRKTYKDKI